MKIAIGNDHAAGELKNELIACIEALGHEVVDYGAAIGEAVNCYYLVLERPRVRTI